jgi:hypothetical protein
MSESDRERRRSPRVEVVGRVVGRAVESGAAVTVLDFSLGGMSVRSSVPFEPSSLCEFDVELGDGSLVRMKGIVRHCRNISTGQSDPSYISGFEFVDDESRQTAVSQT